MFPRHGLLGWFSGHHAGRAFLAPTVILLLLLTIFPFLFALALAFGKVSVLGPLRISFQGGQNWVRLFHDERFWNSLTVTVKIAGVATILEYVLGLGLALLLNQRVPGRGFFRMIFLMPMMLAPIAVGYLWRMMFGPAYGPINGVLTRLGLPMQEWLTDSQMAIWAVIMTDVWQWTPFVLLILFAGLQAIPTELIEAARVDGAKSWQLFFHVIFPLLAPASIAAILLRLIEAFKIVDIIYILTTGGPGISTESLTLYAYSIGLRTFDLAYGSTLAFSLFLTVLVASLIFVRGVRRYQEVRY
ncbi:TPA: sugar ABC transporter permease [Candidatus Bipolaricaulota bacterium]|nr:sugar ABC transporter permease [Candidatus Bipolaricaulota bacterium]